MNNVHSYIKKQSLIKWYHQGYIPASAAIQYTPAADGAALCPVSSQMHGYQSVHRSES